LISFQFVHGANVLKPSFVFSLKTIFSFCTFLLAETHSSEVDYGEVPVYLGVGGRLKLQENDEDKFGIRFPVGLAYEFVDVPVDLFVEVVPIWDVALSYDFDLEGGVGLRFISSFAYRQHGMGVRH
jgi:hypothetical protein